MSDRAPSVDSTWVGTLASGVSIGGTSSTLSSVVGTNWPSGSGIFGIQIGEDPDTDGELVQVTRSGSTLTNDASTPTFTKAHSAGANVYYLTTAADINAKLDSSALDTDGTLAANSDSKVTTQKATKTYADTKAALAGAAFTGNVRAPNGSNSSNGLNIRADNMGLNSPSSNNLVLAVAGSESQRWTSTRTLISRALEFQEELVELSGDNYTRTSTTKPVVIIGSYDVGSTFTLNTPTDAAIQIIVNTEGLSTESVDIIGASSTITLSVGEAAILIWDEYAGVWVRL